MSLFNIFEKAECTYRSSGPAQACMSRNSLKKKKRCNLLGFLNVMVKAFAAGQLQFAPQTLISPAMCRCMAESERGRERESKEKNKMEK